MKKIFLFLAFILLSFSVGATTRKRAELSQTKYGKYIPSDIITKTKLKDLPVPQSLENYAFLQSIGKTTNIVIGDFESGENIITLITDTNADGTVDFVSEWNLELKKFREYPKPAEFITKEKFLQLKKDIFYGNYSDKLKPNREALTFLSKIMTERATRMMRVNKNNQGYMISVQDADDTKRNRLTFSFSDNGNRGKDISFEVVYRVVGEYDVIPVIRYGVFCKNSFDPYVLEIINDIKKVITDNYTE